VIIDGAKNQGQPEGTEFIDQATVFAGKFLRHIGQGIERVPHVGCGATEDASRRPERVVPADAQGQMRRLGGDASQLVED
jgi:hypothetical protein